MNIVYSYENGVIKWECQEELKGLDGSKILLKASGQVPNALKDKGETTIRSFVQTAAAKIMEERRKVELAFLERQKNPGNLVSTQYDGIILKGKIIYASHRKLTAELLNPYKGSRDMYFGWASAMAGRRIWNQERELSEDAIRTARHLLIEIYKEQATRQDNIDDIDLVNRLNR